VESMNALALFIYSASLRTYKTGAQIKSLWNKKAKQWIEGQKNSLNTLLPKTNTRVWFHCASVGEFEQARPLIELVKKENPAAEIVLTFFSPSGLELRKNYPFADYVLYLPLDSKFSSANFIEKVKPDIAIFVKYELWYYYLSVLKERKIPAYLISAVFRSNHWLNTWYGKSFKAMLQNFKAVFVQNESSKTIAEDLGCKNVMMTGDTRVDRVLAGVNENKRFAEIENWLGGKNLFIAGSTWHEDEQLIVKFINEDEFKYRDWKWIIVPHEISEKHLQSLKYNIADNAILYSELNEENKNVNILIIDRIGMLAYLYRYAQVAYVGGGFGKGIHNILEPAVYGAPVIFGPKYQSFIEAVNLVQHGADYSIKDYDEFKYRMMNELGDITLREHAKHISAEYIAQQKGATEKIFEVIFKNI
jgi:3-deoxy-D-manno-octulosonic-acid transferase